MAGRVRAYSTRICVETNAEGPMTSDEPTITEPPRAYRGVVKVLRPVLMAVTKRHWSGVENLPRTGGFVVCPNHVSYTDFLALAHLMYDSGRPVFFLGKSGLFETPVIGRIITAADQIPVYRGTERAVDAYRAAVQAVRDGKAVAMYPEGTLTRDPGVWPMKGKTGAARVALETRCPVIPIAMYGPEQLLAPYSSRLRLFPRKTMRIVVGSPVFLDDLYGRADADAAREATDRIMAAITRQLAEVRGEDAPAEAYDARKEGAPAFRKPPRRWRRRR